MFLVSDFLGGGYEKPMRVLGKQHDLIAISVSDPREVSMPDVGLIELEDAETGEMVMIDTGSAAVRRHYENLGRQRAERLERIFDSMGVDHIDVRTDHDYVRDIVRFFKARERRR